MESATESISLLESLKWALKPEAQMDETGYKYKQYYIPADILDSLKLYVDAHRPVGSFLMKVLCNDLRGAIERGDEWSVHNLSAYVAWLYNEAPKQCWGSPERVEAWLKARGEGQ